MKKRQRNTELRVKGSMKAWYKIGSILVFAFLAKMLSVAAIKQKAVGIFGIVGAALKYVSLVLILCSVLLIVIEVFRIFRRNRLLEKQTTLENLKALSWQEFENVVCDCYKRWGYRVLETGLGGADGGVDLLMKKNEQTILVQCKKWKANVGAPVVREMYGLMLHHKADQVKIVCCGSFSKDAWAFSVGKTIELIGGHKLLHMIQTIRR